MSWATRRRNLYLVTFGTISLIIIALVSFLFLYQEPTCTDRLWNGTETGVDCGGACTKICPHEAQAPIIKWSRSFKVKEGLWSAVAYVENRNPKAGARSAHYVIKLFDEENVIVAIKEGETQLAPDSVTAVFYANIPTGSRVPRQTFFEFDPAIAWERMDTPTAPIRVAQSRLENEQTAPRLTALVENTTRGTLSAQLVTALMYDTNGNAIGASQTILPTLPRDGKEELVFTWPIPFEGIVSRSEIVPLIAIPSR